MLLLSMITSAEGKSKFRLLYERYNKLVYWIAMQRLGNREKAEDCVQETFLYIANHLEKVGEVDSKSTKCYVATIAEGKAISIYRKEVKHIANLYDDGKMSVDITSFGLYDSAELSFAIDRLDDETRNMVYLRYVYGFTSKEIGSFYGISDALVRKKLQKGLGELKKFMEADEKR